jgi:hypothetical protein
MFALIFERAGLYPLLPFFRNECAPDAVVMSPKTVNKLKTNPEMNNLRFIALPPFFSFTEVEGNLLRVL